MTSIFPSRVAPAKDASDFQMQHASLKPQRYKTLMGMCHSLGQKGNIKVTTNTLTATPGPIKTSFQRQDWHFFLTKSVHLFCFAFSITDALSAYIFILHLVHNSQFEVGL